MAVQPLEIIVTGNTDGATSGLKKVQNELGNTAISAQKVDSSLKITEKSFVGIGSKAAQALSSIGQASGGAVGGVFALGSSLLTGGILVAIPLIIEGVKLLGQAFNNTNKAQEELNKTLSDAGASTAGNVARLQALVSIAKDVTKNDIERKEALGALNKEYSDFNGKLTLANINTAESTKLINEQTEAIVRQAKIKGVQDLITKVSQKNTEALTKDLKENLGFFDKVGVAALSALSPAIGGADEVVTGIKRRNEVLIKGEETINSYKEVLKKLLEEDALGGTLFKEPKDKASKGETIYDVLKKLRLELDYLNSKELTLKTDEAKAKISALEGTIKTLFEKFNLKNDNKIVVGLYGEIKEIQLTEKLKNNLKFNVDAPEFVLRPKIDIEPVFNSRGWIDKIIDEIDLARKKAADKLKSFQDSVAASIKEIETGALVGLGEAIGNALGGKGDIFRGLFDSIFSSVGDQLKNLGKFLIASGIEIKIAKDAFRKLLANPIASIAVGIGLVALGALLKSQIGKQAPGFATGVRNYGGGLALVGERGPELVTLPKGSSVQTNGQLNGMSMDNWAGNVVFEIDGIKLRGLLQRTDSYANRNGF